MDWSRDHVDDNHYCEECGGTKCRTASCRTNGCSYSILECSHRIRNLGTTAACLPHDASKHASRRIVQEGHQPTQYSAWCLLVSACVARHYRAGRAPADTVLLYSCMHQVCSSNHCEGEASHQEFACVACTDSVVLDCSRGEITMLQRGLDGSRRLFPGQSVDALVP